MAVEEVDIRGDRAKRARRILIKCVREALRNQGDDFAGFGLVVWDMKGECNSSYLAEYGMVGESLMPSFTADALNRHLSVVLVERTHSQRIESD